MKGNEGRNLQTLRERWERCGGCCCLAHPLWLAPLLSYVTQHRLPRVEPSSAECLSTANVSKTKCQQASVMEVSTHSQFPVPRVTPTKTSTHEVCVYVRWRLLGSVLSFPCVAPGLGNQGLISLVLLLWRRTFCTVFLKRSLLWESHVLPFSL